MLILKPVIVFQPMSYIRQDPCMLYMVTFTINIPPMLAYIPIPYMDPMGITMDMFMVRVPPAPKTDQRYVGGKFGG